MYIKNYVYPYYAYPYVVKLLSCVMHYAFLSTNYMTELIISMRTYSTYLY